MNDIRWYDPHYIPNVSQPNLLLEHLVSRAATNLTYIKRTVITRDVTTETIWTFELEIEKGKEVQIYIVVWFMHKYKILIHSVGQLSTAQSIIGTENYPDAEKLRLC